MKFLKYYIWLVLGVATLFAACKKDNSTLANKSLSEFYVDSLASPRTFEIEQSVEPLVVTPNVIYGADATKLSYLWRMYDRNTTFIDTLSRNKDLNVKTSRPAGKYLLELQIAEDGTGIKAFMTYNVTINSPVPYGWLVLYETATGSTDVGLIRTSDFVKNLPADQVMRTIYSNANGGALTGTPLSISSTFDGEFVVTSATAVRVNIPDYKKLSDFNGLFRGLNPAPKPEGLLNFGISRTNLINDGSVYWSVGGTFLGKVVVDERGYKAMPGGYSQLASPGGFFDTLNGRFIALKNSADQANVFDNASVAAKFNLNNIDKNLLFIGNGTGGFDVCGGCGFLDPYDYAFFEDKDKSRRWFYGINFYNASRPDLCMVDISAFPGIFNAKFFDLGTVSSIGFYGTTQSVYSFEYTVSSNSAINPKMEFTVPGGEEITEMKLFQDTGTGFFGSESKLNRIMFVSTWNASTKNGKVYLLSVDRVTGNLGVTPLKVFDGFGKIKQMTLKFQ